MNRNTEDRFANLPSVHIGRSKFDRSFTHKTSFSAGDLIPIYVDPDIIPGDTVKMRVSEIIRMNTPLVPVMDNCFMDVYFFFVPDRLVWDDFKRFMGENDTAPWTQQNSYQIPQIKITNGSKNSSTNKLTKILEIGSLYEKMGIPPQNWTYSAIEDKTIKISALPARAYCLIWNEFFRDENLQNPVNISKSSGTFDCYNKNDASYTADADAFITSFEQRGGLPPLKVCKPHDYFTSCLPGAQKGPAVSIPLTSDIGMVKWKDVGGIHQDDAEGMNVYINEKVSGSAGNYSYAPELGWHDDQTGTDVMPSGTLYGNLFVDLQNATGATINQLRQAFAIQKFYERDARGGTRYIESVFSHFGVRNPDYRLQRPEYLGGYRHNININQVVQTSPVEQNSTPLGATGAYSVTSHSDPDVFTHSFTEHGILMGLMCVRTTHTYQQGINRSWFKKDRLDFYTPEFANLGEMAVLNEEIYADGSNYDKQAFGYQEAWAEMRYMPDIVTGILRSQYAQSLDVWTYADYYNKRPVLGDKWIQETSDNIERTLAVQDEDQFIGDFYFGAIYTRPLPLYSIPGLIDHH